MCVVSIIILIVLDRKSVNIDNNSLFLFEGTPCSLAIVCVAYSGNIVFPHIERSMRRPQHWPFVLCLAIATVSMLYLVLSVVCYYQNGGLITKNIVKMLKTSSYQLIPYILMIIHMLVIAPVTILPMEHELEQFLGLSRLRFRVGLRIVVMLLLVSVTYFDIPLKNYIYISSVIVNSLIFYIAPLVLYYKIYGIRNRKYIEYIWVIVIASAGLGTAFLSLFYVDEGNLNTFF